MSWSPCSTSNPAGHKIATARIEKGAPVRKYGQIIGQATADVQPGEWVHSHNLINGEWKESHTGKTFERHNPATGELVGTYTSSDSKDVDDAVATFQNKWQNSSWRKRLLSLENLVTSDLQENQIQKVRHGNRSPQM